MENKTKIDALFDLLPSTFNARGNPNWSAIVNAIGGSDQNITDLISLVHQQFFVKTASRPYLDNLASNSNVSRPAVIGMDDPAFRQYIPVISYKPKQVKLILDQLLYIFFFAQATTAYIVSSIGAPYALQDGYNFKYLVDELHSENITFFANDFTDISMATATEVASAINRQAQYSYAIAEYDSISKNTYVEIFTNTIGSKGSIRIEGGTANGAFQFNGFNAMAGLGNNTQWTISTVGQDVTMQWTGGLSPGLANLLIGDIVVLNLPGPTGNKGSFVITSVDIGHNLITFENLFAVAGTYTQTDSNQSQFIRPNKNVAYLNPKRAMTWETSQGEITIEMPTSPPVVKRSLKGSAHLNGAFSSVVSTNSSTSLTLVDALDFPVSGNFWLQPVEEIIEAINTISESTTLTQSWNTRLIFPPMQNYHYTDRTVLATTGDLVVGNFQITNLASTAGIAKNQQIVMAGLPPYTLVESVVGTTVNVSQAATTSITSEAVSFLGNTLSGITPNLPDLATLNVTTITSLSRTSNVVTGTTSTPNGLNVGDMVTIQGSSGITTFTTTGNTTIETNVISGMASTLGLDSGMLVSGPGIDTFTEIQSVSPTSVTLTRSATSSNTGATYNFSENLNGTFVVTSVSPTTFRYNLVGSNGTASVPGVQNTEEIGMAPTGSIVYLTDAVPASLSRIYGPYIWDPIGAPFVLSADTASIQQNIQAGTIVKLLNLDVDNTIPSATGFVVFDYGLNTQEGPIKYLYKPSTNTIIVDPSYTFKFNHSAGSAIQLVESMGPHVMSGSAAEYPAYITDPSQARIILEGILESVTSAGIFVNFLINYPEQIFGIYDDYNQQGLGAGQPFSD